MYALVDCNSFFCAVERVFHPGLRGKPVCVLSNNDGCIVALTPEAKALGLRRGVPLYQVEDIVRHGQVRVFSSNMYLYAVSEIGFAPENAISEVKEWGAHIVCHCKDGALADVVEILDGRY